jgi:energy-coupling factor transporter transmembrane protein EcfT
MWREKLKLHKENPIQALHPSCKLIIVILFSVCTIIIGTFKINGYALLLIPWFAFVPCLCAASGVLGEFIKAFRKILFIVAIIFVVQSMLIPGEIILWQMGFVKIYENGLQSAIVFSFMISSLAGIFIWMFQTTKSKEISRALEDSGMNYKAAYIFISTLQMINVLGKNSRIIMDAQRARGVETEGNIIIRAKAFFPSLVPLVLGSITGAEERALTLEAKGFDVNCKKTHMFELERSGNEKTAIILAAAFTVIIIMGRVML